MSDVPVAHFNFDVGVFRFQLVILVIFRLAVDFNIHVLSDLFILWISESERWSIETVAGTPVDSNQG